MYYNVKIEHKLENYAVVWVVVAGYICSVISINLKKLIS
jgi:hypothetical protein